LKSLLEILIAPKILAVPNRTGTKPILPSLRFLKVVSDILAFSKTPPTTA